MAHRRRHRRRRHARANPVSDTTKIILAVGVTAAVSGLGYYLYKRQQTPSDKQLPGGGGGGGDAGDAAKRDLYQKALTDARLKFAALGAAGPNEVYAFQMAIGAVQALGVPAEDVIGIAWAAVVAHFTGSGFSQEKAEAAASFIRDEAGLGPEGAAGAAAIAENIRKRKYGTGPAWDSP